MTSHYPRKLASRRGWVIALQSETVSLLHFYVRVQVLDLLIIEIVSSIYVHWRKLDSVSVIVLKNICSNQMHIHNLFETIIIKFLNVKLFLLNVWNKTLIICLLFLIKNIDTNSVANLFLFNWKIFRFTLFNQLVKN